MQSNAQESLHSNRDAAERELVRQTTDLKTMMAAWAANAPTVDSLRAPTPASRGAALDELSTLARSKDSPSALVTDLQGRIVELYPSQPRLIGRDFAFRDWFEGASRSGRPYVSEAFRTAAAAHPLVVAVTAPVLDPSRRVGYIGVLWQLDSVRAVSQGAHADDGVTISVSDQRGQPLTGTPHAQRGEPWPSAKRWSAMAPTCISPSTGMAERVRWSSEEPPTPGLKTAGS